MRNNFSYFIFWYSTVHLHFQSQPMSSQVQRAVSAIHIRNSKLNNVFHKNSIIIFYIQSSMYDICARICRNKESNYYKSV